MNVSEFLSGSHYIVLPNKYRARVYLALGNKESTRLAFDLYNPFSKKAKAFKFLTRFLCLYANPLAKLVLPSIRSKKSTFIEFLENRLNTKLTTAVYLATEKDKVVIQLQNKNGVFGYLKFPMSPLGEKRLLKEQAAIRILSKQKLVPALLFDDTYLETPFIALQNLEGTIGKVGEWEYRHILNALKKDKYFPLREHPRIQNLKNELRENKLTGLGKLLNNVVAASDREYLEVFEHGDFAPWNLIKTQNGIVPFDFEYFEEQGLEFLDEIKFHFQIAHLLRGKKGNTLISALSSRVMIAEFDLILQVFLLKEIINKCKAGASYDLEIALLRKLSNAEA
jgi:hypothetical protein